MIENQKYLKELITQGYVMEKFSSDGKLVLYNYTNKAMYDKKWNKITLNVRGHIYEVGTNKLVAMAFSKFFNLSELTTSKQRNLLKKTGYRCYEKVDGSLGIIYYYDGCWRINTRGSFNSEQANEALFICAENDYDFSHLDKEYTLLVEIIYPNNRIIIDYKNEKKLVLLAEYNINTGQESTREVLKSTSKLTEIQLVKEYKLTFDEMFEFQESMDLTKEGFVVQFKNGERVKIKSKYYLKIARILANLTPLGLWKMMENGKVKRESLEVIPEEFRAELEIIVQKLQFEYVKLLEDIKSEYFNVMIRGPTRKEIGQNKDIKHKGAIFSLIDNKKEKIDNYIMKRIRPRGNNK